MRVRVGWILAAAAVLGCVGEPVDAVRGSVVQYGRFGGELGALRMDRGRVFRGEPPAPESLMEATTDIPCRIGEKFGAYFLVAPYSGPLDHEPFLIVWQHPEIRDAANHVVGTSTEYSAGGWVIDARRVVTFAGWTIDDAADLVEGAWSASLYYRGDVMATQHFRTVGCPARVN